LSGEKLTRRTFVHRLSFFGGGVLLLGPACDVFTGKRSPPPPVKREWALVSSHRTFTDAEFRALSAAVDRILPRDADPGALDANVPEYIDRALVDPQLHEMRDDLIPGLGLLETRAHGSYQKAFADLSVEQRDQILDSLRKGEKGSMDQRLLELLIVLTMEGFLSDPSYGGNKDRVGWALVGFDTSMPADYQPPVNDPLVQLHHHH
jgi:gluconate 2-dehydrogenase gamma chain